MSGVIQAIDDQLFKHEDLQNKKVCLMTVRAPGVVVTQNPESHVSGLNRAGLRVSRPSVRPLSRGTEQSVSLERFDETFSVLRTLHTR